LKAYENELTEFSESQMNQEKQLIIDRMDESPMLMKSTTKMSQKKKVNELIIDGFEEEENLVSSRP
jgi:hypothetical protein